MRYFLFGRSDRIPTSPLSDEEVRFATKVFNNRKEFQVKFVKSLSAIHSVTASLLGQISIRHRDK